MLKFILKLNLIFLMLGTANHIFATAANTVTGTVANSTGTPFLYGERIAITPDGTTAYACAASNPVAIINIATNTITGYVTTTGYPFNSPGMIAFTPDGSKAYVMNNNNNNVCNYSAIKK